jgi:hypothetical protein
MPISHRNTPDTLAPMMPPTCWKSAMCDSTTLAATARPRQSASKMLECPSEKRNPTPSGRSPFCSMKRVVSSIAEMWSASKAWRSPKV